MLWMTAVLTLAMLAVFGVKLHHDHKYQCPHGCGNVNSPASCICRNSDHRPGHLL